MSTIDPGCAPGLAEVSTREASCDHVDRGEDAQLTNVSLEWDVGEPLLEDALSASLDL
jgi:hypothetical protein